MKVLSLFDGISCGRVALDRLNIPVEAYVAFETDKYATQVSRKNYPLTEHKGDVFYGDYTKYKGFDLLLGGSPCFVAGTMIRTIDGFKPIEEIKVGDKVLTHKNRFKSVKAIMDRVAPSTVIIKSENCGEIECTKEHPFYTKEMSRIYDAKKRCYRRVLSSDFNWVSPEYFCKIVNSSDVIKKQTYVSSVTDDIKKVVKYNGTKIKTNQFSFKHVSNLDLNDEHLWYIIGRWVGDGWYSYKYKNNKDKKLSGIKICCGKHEIDELEKKIKLSGLNYYKSMEKTVCKFNINNLEFAEYLQKFGKGALNKHLSPETFFLKDSLAMSFLNGYFDADGCIKNDIGSFFTVSKELAYGIKYMVNKYMKVSCSVVKNQRQNNNKIDNRKVNVNESYTGTFRLNKRKQSHYFVENSYIFSPYKSIVFLDEPKLVYNMSVEEDESYIANGLVVHNCTYWSIAKNNREVTPDGIGGQLFMQYVRALKESGCKYFIYENNYSIHQDIKDFISEQLGVQPIMINSALVSAQQRKRCYWTNIPGVTQPEDLKIVLKDILENYPVDKKYEIDPKGCAMRGRYLKGNSGETQQQIEIRKDDKTNAITTVSKDCLICEPVISQHGHEFNKDGIKRDECPTITANESFAHNNSIIEPCQGINLSNYVDKKYEEYAKEHNGEIPEIFNPYNKRKLEDKSPTLTTGAGSTTTSATVLVFQPIRIGTIGNGGQGERIYSVKGKSVTLSANGGGRGAKTGLYKVDLPDGDYIIRKLTPVEAERLQTLPDNYTAFGMTEDGKLVKISNTQRYKQIGNGWTVDVIAHILSFLPNDDK